jgi:D-alanyl-D-alanine carboxypeptidase/D-alanyl-D-alanine-endopeptidase (penicillin-binding protein 4)
MRKALLLHGISVSGRAATGEVAFGATDLSAVRSKPLWKILRAMDRFSDNYIAEMVIKAVGALGGAQGSTAGGLAVAQTVLQDTIGDDAKNLHLVDGSGLSSANRLTASALAELLARTSLDPTLGPPLRQALAVAGVNGTLRNRPSGSGRVLAKTGTLDGVSSLSGYATTQSGACFAFAILMNGHRLSDSEAHEAQDKIAALVAAQPYPRRPVRLNLNSRLRLAPRRRPRRSRERPASRPSRASIPGSPPQPRTRSSRRRSL